MALTVNEIFYSIQGESSFAGYPCVFVRLTGCNLRCRYCDTQYAYEEGVEMEIGAILKAVGDFSSPLVEITGGEPLLQPQTPDLVSQLLERGYRVLVETNGSFDINRIDSRAVRIVDVKCPSSGEQDRNDLQNLKRLSPLDEVKFVIGNREDYEFARRILKLVHEKQRGARPDAAGKVHFSPVSEKLAPRELAAWILEDRLPVRLNLQLHKILWPDAQRGK